MIHKKSNKWLFITGVVVGILVIGFIITSFQRQAITDQPSNLNLEQRQEILEMAAIHFDHPLQRLFTYNEISEESPIIVTNRTVFGIPLTRVIVDEHGIQRYMQ